jgi:DNA primase
LAELGRPVRIVGLPGIAALAHLCVKKGERILIVADGDEPDSPAAKALFSGTDALLLQGASVRVTQTPPGEDANSILQRGGIEALAELISDNYPAELTDDGEITRLSRLDPLDYERGRRAAAERLGIRLSTLDQQSANAAARRQPQPRRPILM